MLPQTISELTKDDEAQLRKQRQVVENHLARECRQKYATVAGKVGLIRALLTAGTFAPEKTYELQCLGIVFGDALVQELGMEWIMISDELGRDPAIRMPGTSILLYPLTMISKRIEGGEKLDVFDLFIWAADEVERLRAKHF